MKIYFSLCVSSSGLIPDKHGADSDRTSQQGGGDNSKHNIKLSNNTPSSVIGFNCKET